jgi:Purple acid Phosphatase, N-terminal domain
MNFAKPASLLVSAVFLLSIATVAQNSQPASDAPADQHQATVVNVVEGPIIQYADDEFAVITWTSDKPSESRIFYGKTSSNLNQVAEDGKSLSVRHQVDLRNLQPNTMYYFRVDTGQTGEAASTALNSFQTVVAGGTPMRNQPPYKPSTQPVQNAQADAAAPDFGKVSVTRGPTIQYVDDISAVISWATNVPANNTLYYGPDRNNLLYTAGNFKDATEHRIHLSELKPNTTYYFQFDGAPTQIGSFRTVGTGAPPLYDQPAAGFSGAVTLAGNGPQLSRRERSAVASNSIPSGTELDATLDSELSTKTSQPGQRFTATLSDPVRDADDNIMLPVGTHINGQVTESEEGKTLPQLRGRGKLNMRFESVTLPSGRSFPISATLLTVRQSGGNGSVNSEGEVQSGTSAGTAAKGVGVGAGIGTIAGFILGGPLKGLAIGALAGGGYILATKGKDVELPAGTGLHIRLDQNLMLPVANPRGARE